MHKMFQKKLHRKLRVFKSRSRRVLWRALMQFLRHIFHAGPHRLLRPAAALTLALALVIQSGAFGYSGAYFSDFGLSSGNPYQSGTLAFSLSDGDDFDDAVTPLVSATTTAALLDAGSAAFQYRLKADNLSGDLCSVLNIKAGLDGTEEYNGPLAGLDIASFVFADPEVWDFEASLSDSNEIHENKICDFDLVFSGWQTGFAEGGGGFTHQEILPRTVATGEWDGSPVIDPIADFAVFGASDVSDSHETETGNNTSVFTGLVGSNRSVSIGGGNFSQGIRAGADITVGNNSEIGLDGIIANGAVDLGGGVDVSGETHGDSILVGNNSELSGRAVSGGAFTIGGGTQAQGDVDAQSATLGNNADILGTLTLPPATSPILGGGASVATLVNSTPAAPDTFASVSLPAPNTYSSSGEAGKDVLISSGNSPLILPPGIYRDLSSGNNLTLNLTSGTYVFRSVILGGGNTINADVSAGKILIFVENDFETGNNLNFNLTGGTAADVYLESAGTVTLGGGNDWYGTIYSTQSGDPGAFGVETGNNVDVWGGLYSAQQVKLGGGNNVTLVGPYFGTYSAPVSALGVVLNEIYPNPDTGDPAPNNREWIELYNNTAGAVDVLGWKISEMSGASEVFYTVVAVCPGSGTAGKIAPYSGADTEIAASGLLVLQFCPASQVLNNGGDTVRLYDGSNTFLDGHAYPSTAAEKSHTRIPDGVGVWVDPEPTPGSSNRVRLQDLIASGLDEKTIDMIIALLAARGETLLPDEAPPAGPLTSDIPGETESEVPPKEPETLFSGGSSPFVSSPLTGEAKASDSTPESLLDESEVFADEVDELLPDSDPTQANYSGETNSADASDAASGEGNPAEPANSPSIDNSDPLARDDVQTGTATDEAANEDTPPIPDEPVAIPKEDAFADQDSTDPAVPDAAASTAPVAPETPAVLPESGGPSSAIESGSSAPETPAEPPLQSVAPPIADSPPSESAPLVISE